MHSKQEHSDRPLSGGAVSSYLKDLRFLASIAVPHADPPAVASRLAPPPIGLPQFLYSPSLFCSRTR